MPPTPLPIPVAVPPRPVPAVCVGDIKCGDVDNLVRVAEAEESWCNRAPLLTARLPLNALMLLTFKALSRRTAAAAAAAAAAAVVPPAARLFEGNTGASFTGAVLSCKQHDDEMCGCFF